MVRFSVDERLDMYNVYIRNYRNSVAASQSYANMYPERRQPNRNIFQRISLHLNEFGTLENVRNNRPVIETVNEINVLAQIHINPESSQRKIALECNLSKSGVQKILKKHKYHAFKVKPVQKLHPGDNQRRLEFCHWFRDQLREDPDFSTKILWSDETTFTNSGMFNTRNKHFYAVENPYLIQEVRPQIRFSINIWCGLLDDQLIGPYFIPGYLTGLSYANFLQNDFEIMLDDLPLVTLRNLRWFQQDGAGPHNARNVRQYLDERFPDSWIGTNGPVRWPPRSPCLNPLDYFLWGFMKNKVYDRPVQNVEYLQAKLTEAFQSITPVNIRNAVRNMDRRTSLCIEHMGTHFEQFM